MYFFGRGILLGNNDSGLKQTAGLCLIVCTDIVY